MSYPEYYHRINEHKFMINKCSLILWYYTMVILHYQYQSRNCTIITWVISNCLKMITQNKQMIIETTENDMIS